MFNCVILNQDFHSAVIFINEFQHWKIIALNNIITINSLNTILNNQFMGVPYLSQHVNVLKFCEFLESQYGIFRSLLDENYNSEIIYNNLILNSKEIEASLKLCDSWFSLVTAIIQNTINDFNTININHSCHNNHCYFYNLNKNLDIYKSCLDNLSTNLDFSDHSVNNAYINNFNLYLNRFLEFRMIDDLENILINCDNLGGIFYSAETMLANTIKLLDILHQSSTHILGFTDIPEISMSLTNEFIEDEEDFNFIEEYKIVYERVIERNNYILHKYLEN